MAPPSERSRTALITGANRGIGLETARQLAARGWRVMACARQSPFPKAARSTLLAANHHTLFTPLDLNAPSSIDALALRLDQSFPSLDLLINNAAILTDRDESIRDIGLEIIETTFRVNTVGPIRVTRACLPALQRADTPLVINVSSAAGSLTEMRDWAPAYSLSKTALNAVTRQFALTLGKEGIAVCCLSPGWVRTAMGGPGATRSVEDAAGSIVQLLDEEPKTLNGRFLRDGKDLPW